jgi:hypothetical protein
VNALRSRGKVKIRGTDQLKFESIYWSRYKISRLNEFLPSCLDVVNVKFAGVTCLKAAACVEIVANVNVTCHESRQIVRVHS